MDQSAFLRYVKERQGVRYSQTSLSRWESGVALIGPDQIRVFGPLDPQGRGAVWLLGELSPEPERRRKSAAATPK